MEGPLIFALNSSKRFGEKVGVKCCVIEKEHPDKEFLVKPDENIRDKDVFVIQSVYQQEGEEDLTRKLTKLLMFCNSAHYASAGRVTAVIPYLPFSRQDRKTEPRAPLSSRMLADLLEAVYVDRLLTMDVHNPAVQNAYNIPSDFLVPFKLLAENLYSRIHKLSKNDKLAIIAPDAGATKERVEPLEKKIHAYTPKHEFELITGSADKRRVDSSKIRSEGFMATGDITNALTIIPDDETVTGSSIINAAKQSKERGAGYVLAFVTHCKINSEYAKKIQECSYIDEFIITDTICKPENFFKKYPKFKELSVAPLFYEAIQNIHDGKSLTTLF